MFLWDVRTEDGKVPTTASATMSQPPAPDLFTRLSRTSVPSSWNAKAKRHVFYRLSPFLYAASGLLLGHVERDRPHAISFEPYIFCLQTVLTYMSDVVTLGTDSPWHAADRLHAYGYTIFRSIYTPLAYWWLGAYAIEQLAAFAIGLALSLVCIRRSWQSVMARDVDGFLLWHATWHLALPLTVVVIVALDVLGRCGDCGWRPRGCCIVNGERSLFWYYS